MSILTKEKLKRYLQNDLNVLISGESGTGKTSIVLDACNELGYKALYYHAPTTDPFIHLVGVPVPDKEAQRTVVYPPEGLDDVEVIIIDELNRGKNGLEDVCFELLQFKSINKRKLSNLKAVVSSINPPNENYIVRDLDFALVDRFDVRLTTDLKLNKDYLYTKYDSALVDDLDEFYNSYIKEYRKARRDELNDSKGYISPRKIDDITEQYLKIKRKDVIADMLPLNASSALKPLYDVLSRHSKKNIHQDYLEDYYSLMNDSENILKNLEALNNVLSSNSLDISHRKQLTNVLIDKLDKMPLDLLMTKGFEETFSLLNAQEIKMLLKDKDDNYKSVFTIFYSKN